MGGTMMRIRADNPFGADPGGKDPSPHRSGVEDHRLADAPGRADSPAALGNQRGINILDKGFHNEQSSSIYESLRRVDEDAPWIALVFEGALRTRHLHRSF